MPTKIDWCDEVWNPVTGCSKISLGCEHCYAERMAKRLAGRCGYPKRNPFRVTVHEDKLYLPLSWKKPRRIFVNSMGDLFHPDVSLRWICAVLGVISAAPQHTFLVLTKRPARAKNIISSVLPNLCIGVTVENADYLWRVKELLNIPAAKRFVSVEPMLGLVDIVQNLPNNPRRFSERNHFKPFIDWVICGGETGPGARPMMSEWVVSLRDQCVDAGVPFFFKGWGTALRPKDATYQLIEGREWKQFPEK
jgi:protein gp37